MSRGFALPLTLLAMVVIGGLVAAILFVAMIGRRSGAAMLELAQVQYAAEAAAYRVAGGLSSSTATSIPVSDAASDVGGHRLTRFGTPVWLVEANASGDRFGALRRAGLILVSRPRNVLVDKGLSVRGTVSFVGTSRVDLFGIEAGEGCGLAAPDTVSGPVFESAAFESLGDWLARATKLIANGAVVTPHPKTVGGVCDVSQPFNWGDPVDPVGGCSSFFPVVAGAGDMTVEGGEGQGVLVVSGDLTARSGFRFRGLVLVRGRLLLENGARMVGAVQVDDSSSAGSVLNGGQIGYSGCALREALANFGVVSALGSRGWFQPY